MGRYGAEEAAPEKEEVARRERADGASLVQGDAITAMGARRSFKRSMGKFQPEVVDKPVAILTAFRGEVPLADNRRANAQLTDTLKRMNLGFFPVKGAGQEERRWLFGVFRYVVPASEESFLVQPRADMT